ncbi:hypothetical protein LLG90_09060 [Aromatoleum toluclasticum]|uniref:hypothetical protein n=1 Tax=Aromatoleum toluclasticum TaxID=92003 RepID=UPI001D1832DB|nr:hypothetical protein [Aromatoleum toluclasticum]MCC4115497.1 hypothetical protein [Aromatoleum toluclasticum]
MMLSLMETTENPLGFPVATPVPVFRLPPSGRAIPSNFKQKQRFEKTVERRHAAWLPVTS